MIKVNAKQTKLQFVKDGPITYRYILRPETFSQLKAEKVLDEAAAHSGIARGALKGAWDAIGEVIKNWLTEGHSLPLPGIGTVRFGLNGESVVDVNDVAKSLIKSRKVIFTPNKDIKEALMACGVSITCIDKDGNIVKRVQDDTSDETDTTEPGNGNDSGNGSGVAAPTISGTTPFADTTSMTISAEAGASIHYTTDGSTPTSSSTQYSSAVTLSATTTVKAIAIKDGVSSSVASKTFTKSDGNGGGNDSPDGVE